MREELQLSKRSKQVDDLPPLGPPTDPYALMSYLGLPAAFRPWSPSKGPPGGYPPFPPCFSGAVPFPPRPGHHHGGGPEASRCQDSERSVSPALVQVDHFRRAASSPPHLAAPPLKRKLLLEKGMVYFSLVSTLFSTSPVFAEPKLYNYGSSSGSIPIFPLQKWGKIGSTT